VEDPPSASPSPRGRNKQQAKSEIPAKSEQHTVLLVEDNPTDIFVIKEALEASGLKLDLRIARDGQDALGYLQRTGTVEVPCPALILLDLNVPKVAGIEVLRKLRTDSRCRRTPVIVVTSSTAETDRTAVERLGAEAYFQKPRNLAAYMELAPLIRKVLQPSAEGGEP